MIGMKTNMEYTVTFIQYHTYTVAADTEEEAVDKAHKEFVSEKRRCIADTWYDTVEIECEEED